MNRFAFLAILAPLALTACTGFTLGENIPGADVWLGDGAIAVDDRTETSFVLASDTVSDPNDPNAVAKSTLFAIDPDSRVVREATDLTGRIDPRLLFPASGLLVMSEEDGKDRLDLFDNETLAPKLSKDLDVRYHGTRMSPSRRFIGVADNTSEKSPIHIIEADTLATHVLPHDGEWLEVMFMNKSDTLVAIVFYDMNLATARARILSWSMDEVAATGYEPDATKFWPKPVLDIEVPGVTADMLFSYTWIGVSPDDRNVVFPVRKVETDVNMQIVTKNELLVLDTMTQELREVPGALGPVGFTPDSSTIVSYGNKTMNGGQELWLIDALTLEVEPEPITIDTALSFFVSREGNFVVVGSFLGDKKLVLYDIDKDETTQMEGPEVRLTEFVSRIGHRELWIVDDLELSRLDFATGEFATVPTTFKPMHVNILPKHDRLVLDDSHSNDIVFFDPSAKNIDSVVTLPVGNSSH